MNNICAHPFNWLACLLKKQNFHKNVMHALQCSNHYVAMLIDPQLTRSPKWSCTTTGRHLMFGDHHCMKVVTGIAALPNTCATLLIGCVIVPIGCATLPIATLLIGCAIAPTDLTIGCMPGCAPAKCVSKGAPCSNS